MGELAAFLASDRCGWMTGQVIHLDGGASCAINMLSRRRDKELYGTEPLSIAKVDGIFAMDK